MKSVKNFRYVEKTSAECNEDSYLAILHLSRVELHCKLQEKFHRVTWPIVYQDMMVCKLNGSHLSVVCQFFNLKLFVRFSSSLFCARSR